MPSRSGLQAGYETALDAFVEQTLADSEFVADLEAFVAPLMTPSRVNSLAQTLLKLTAPGVPDLYQRRELWDLSLVDPDNRRPVDFDRRISLLHDIREQAEADLSRLLRDLLDQKSDGRIKLFVILRALDVRNRFKELFRAM